MDNPLYYSPIPFIILAIYIALASVLIGFTLNKANLPGFIRGGTDIGPNTTYTPLFMIVLFLTIGFFGVGFFSNLFFIVRFLSMEKIPPPNYEYASHLVKVWRNPLVTFHISIVGLSMSAVLYFIMLMLITAEDISGIPGYEKRERKRLTRNVDRTQKRGKTKSTET